MKNKISRISPERKQEINELIEQIRQESYQQGFDDGKVFAANEAVIRVGLRKSANQQRAELIQKAKDFVEVKSKSVKDSSELTSEGGYPFKKIENPNFCSSALKVELFHKGNRVTCLLKGANSNEVVSVGRSNCNPTDVFNLYIGQAISLARALKIDVPVEFLEAVRPTNIAIGQVVHYFDSETGKYAFSAEIDTDNDLNTAQNDLNGNDENYSVTIIDDTNAKYEVATCKN